MPTSQGGNGCFGGHNIAAFVQPGVCNKRCTGDVAGVRSCAPTWAAGRNLQLQAIKAPGTGAKAAMTV
jgi:hypothetical protein